MEKGAAISIKSYKHNGLLHRTWANGVILDETDDYYLIGSVQTKITETNGSVWSTREPAITLYSKNYWYNVVCMFKENGIAFYANLASPSVLDTETSCLKFVDYDIDIRMDVKGKVRVVDLAEYGVNKSLFEYPHNVEKVVEETVMYLVDDAKSERFPFAKKLYQDNLDLLYKLAKK